MAFDVINIGTIPNDGTGDPLRTAFDKTNDNFALAVEGPALRRVAAVAVFDGTTGKLLQDGTAVAKRRGSWCDCDCADVSRLRRWLDGTAGQRMRIKRSHVVLKAP
jgi:hypothetical protein